MPRVGYPDPPTFSASYAEAGAWLDSLPHERIVLGGFSQGCVMALALGLGAGRPRPTAIAGFSGFVPQVAGWELDADRPLPPVALGHGTLDPVIPVEFGRATARQLLAARRESCSTRSTRCRTRWTRSSSSRLREWLDRQAYNARLSMRRAHPVIGLARRTGAKPVPARSRVKAAGAPRAAEARGAPDHETVRLAVRCAL